MVKEQIKLSDYVANIFRKKILKRIAISGGASLHLIHSITDIHN